MELSATAKQSIKASRIFECNVSTSRAEAFSTSKAFRAHFKASPFSSFGMCLFSSISISIFRLCSSSFSSSFSSFLILGASSNAFFKRFVALFNTNESSLVAISCMIRQYNSHTRISDVTFTFVPIVPFSFIKRSTASKRLKNTLAVSFRYSSDCGCVSIVFLITSTIFFPCFRSSASGFKRSSRNAREHVSNFLFACLASFSSQSSIVDDDGSSFCVVGDGSRRVSMTSSRSLIFCFFFFLSSQLWFFAPSSPAPSSSSSLVDFFEDTGGSASNRPMWYVCALLFF
mmetsp:Transcript_5171/g.15263  ORF Transcript_5171/g.15263 Transcript_5171/m.15263 type:complete len:287 (+) Transcript_5171:345-1205(+)